MRIAYVSILNFLRRFPLDERRQHGFAGDGHGRHDEEDDGRHVDGRPRERHGRHVGHAQPRLQNGNGHRHGKGET